MFVQVSNQINQIDTGIQDVASNLEQAFKPSNHPERNTVNTPTEESNTVGDPDNSIPSSSSSDSENSRQRYEQYLITYFEILQCLFLENYLNLAL